jgi:hypothetical protein
MSANRARVWFALFVLVVFGVGLASGVLLGRRMVRSPVPFREFGGPPGLAGARRGGPPPVLLDRLDRELSLTADQKAQVDVVLRASRQRLDQFQQDTRDRFEREQQSLRQDIRKLLTPEQQQKFDRWIEQNPPRGRRGRPPGPPGGMF